MNVIVAGGRDYVLTAADFQFLDHTLRMLRVKEIYTDGNLGVAAKAKPWANGRAFPFHRFPAIFTHAGPATLTERNTTLVALAKAVVAFPGGGSTDDLIAQATLARVSVHESPSRK